MFLSEKGAENVRTKSRIKPGTEQQSLKLAWSPTQPSRP